MSGISNTTPSMLATPVTSGPPATPEKTAAALRPSTPNSAKLSPGAARNAAAQARTRALPPQTRVLISGTGSVGNMMLAALSKEDTTDVVMVGSQRSVDRAQKSGYITVEVGKGLPGSKENIRKVIPVNKPGEYSPGKISVFSKLPENISENAIVIHSGLHKQIEEFLKKPGVSDTLNRKKAVHVVLQNTLDAADVVKEHAQEGATIIQMVMKAAASRKPDVDGTTFTYSQAGVNSAFEAIGVPDHLKEQFSAWFDRTQNRYSSTLLKFGGLDMKYNKVAANAATNPLTVIFNTTNYGGVMERYKDNSRFAALMQGIAMEVYEVGVKRGAFAEQEATKEKTQAGESIVRQPLTLARENLLHPSSTNTSFRGGEETEISGINGGIAKLGAQYGIKTPLNSAITECFAHIEKIRPNYENIEAFYADPEVAGYLQGVQENLLTLAGEATKMDDMHKSIFESYVIDKMDKLNEANEKDPKFVSTLSAARANAASASGDRIEIVIGRQ